MTYHHNTNKPRRKGNVLGSITLIAFALAGVFILTLLAVSRDDEASTVTSAPAPAAGPAAGTSVPAR